MFWKLRWSVTIRTQWASWVKEIREAKLPYVLLWMFFGKDGLQSYQDLMSKDGSRKMFEDSRPFKGSKEPLRAASLGGLTTKSEMMNLVI